MSAGELFDFIRPAVVVISAFLSTWLLVSARKRFPLYLALPLAIAAFFLPFVILPLYFASLIIWPRTKVSDIKWRLILPLLFLTTILTVFSVYTYIDERTVDAHLSRASMAKVHSEPIKAIKEYREALRLEDDPHTRKLLAQTLDESGFFMEAITEFRRAEREGEDDDTIHFRLAILLEKIDHKGEALLEFKQFVVSKTCSQIDYRCEAARQRIEDAESKPR
jgi:tetratricopeptide (TPR) repeat protein